MDIANWPMRKPLAIFAAAIVGIAIGSALWRGCDLPDNLTALIQWFGSITIVAYFASSTTEAVKGVTAYESNYSGEEREYMENTTVNRSVYADSRGDSGICDPSDPSATADSSDGRRPASHPGIRPGKPPKGRKHLR